MYDVWCMVWRVVRMIAVHRVSCNVACVVYGLMCIRSCVWYVVYCDVCIVECVWCIVLCVSCTVYVWSWVVECVLCMVCCVLWVVKGCGVDWLLLNVCFAACIVYCV